MSDVGLDWGVGSGHDKKRWGFGSILKVGSVGLAQDLDWGGGWGHEKREE